MSNRLKEIAVVLTTLVLLVATGFGFYTLTNHKVNEAKSKYTILNALTKAKVPFEYTVYNYGQASNLTIYLDMPAEDKLEAESAVLNEGLTATCNNKEVGNVTIIVRANNKVMASSSWACIQFELGA